MAQLQQITPKTLARQTGFAQLALIGLGIAGAMLVAQGIDVNMTADVPATAENMLDAEPRLRAKAYLALLGFGIGAFISVGLYLLLRSHGPVLALWALVVSMAASVFSLLGAMFAMNAAEMVGNEVVVAMLGSAGQISMLGLQAVSDYTSFHLSLVVATAANGVFFYLFLRSGLIPKLIAGWGVFASLLVVTIIVLRDFVPVLGSGAVTAAFLVANLVAMVALGVYLVIWGVRDV